MKRVLIVSGGFLLMLGLAAGLVFYAGGWRVNLEQQTLTQTGMLAVRSLPEGAKVFLDGKLTTATDQTIDSLSPGTYHLRVIKEGFTPWEKVVEVFPELVTDITAVLVSQSPRLEPLTNTGVSAYALSSSQDRLAYTTKNSDRPGIWSVSLAGTAVNLFRTSASVLISDTGNYLYSNAEKLAWSPDDREMLIKMNVEGYYWLDLTTSPPRLIEELTDPEPALAEWQAKVTRNRQKYLERVEIPTELVEVALDPATVWSPDEQKFLYRVTGQDSVEYRVHNLEEPLPIGEQRNYVPLRLPPDHEPQVTWYSDSYHLILVYEAEIRLIRIDGSNNTQIYGGPLVSPTVYPTPGGDRVIILASFKENVPSDLYTVSLR